MTDRIYFVYGTLRPGGRYWANVEPYVAGYEPARVDGLVLYHLPEGYPAAVPGSGIVFGDLLFIRSGSERVARDVMDEIESYDPRDEEDSLYLRRQVNVRPLRGFIEFIPSWAYIYHPNRQLTLTDASVVASGDWRDRLDGDA